MNNLDNILNSVQAEEQKRQDELAAKEAEEKRQMAEQQHVAQQKNQRREAGQKVRQAIKQDDLLMLTQSVVDAQQKGILDEDYLQKLPEHDSWLAREIKSEKIAEFLLSQIDTKSQSGATFAEDVIDHVLNDEIAPVDKAIELAKKYDVSLKKAADHADKEALLKCFAAGFNAEDYDFRSGLNTYYRYKDGYTKQVSQNDDIDVPPDLEKAAEQKELLIEVIKAGYPLDVEKLKNSKDGFERKTFAFLQELAKDKVKADRFAKLSEDDQHLVAELKADNIEKIRDIIGDGMMKQGVYEYMMLCDTKERGKFMNYYHNLMGEAHKNGISESLNKVEADAVLSGIDDANKVLRMYPRCTEEIKNRLGKMFFEDLDNLMDSKVFIDKYCSYEKNGMNLLAEYIAENFEGKMKAIETSPKIDLHAKEYQRIMLLEACLVINNEVHGNNNLKTALLKYRTTGKPLIRKEKADFFSTAIKEAFSDKYMSYVTTADNQRFNAAVCRKSYTPLSALNQYLRDHKSEVR